MRGIVLALCLALGACALTGKRDGKAIAVYDLGPPAARQPGVAETPLLALDVRAPGWLDSPAITYRLAYAEPGRLRSYAQARWAAAPAALLQQRLSQRLGLAGAGQGAAVCLLRIEIDEFSQVFNGPETSDGILQARATIVDRSRRRLAELPVSLRHTAPSPDSRGGVAALVAAAQQLTDDIGRWQGELSATGQLKACADKAL